MAISEIFGSKAKKKFIAGVMTLSLFPFTASANHEGAHLPSGQRTHIPVVTPGAVGHEAVSAPMSRVEALRASAGGVVLYYGDGIRKTALDFERQALDETLPDYSVQAILGAKSVEIELFINRKIVASYNQGDLDRGRIAADTDLVK